MLTTEQEAALCLNAMPSLGPGGLLSLLAFFGSFEKIVSVGPDNWCVVEGFSPSDIALFHTEFKMALASFPEEAVRLDQNGVNVLLMSDEVYPSLLKNIHHPPPLLYIQGVLPDRASPAVALVGSRRPSFYGEKVARQLARDLSAAGFVTVSGFARGVDAAVHEATLEADGVTWAVLGSGHLCLYPPEHKNLAKKILEKGCLISEFPLSTRPFPGNFPRRNRIVAGLTSATVVVEGAEKSGSLITARLALDFGREVFAVPGPITSPLSKAPHWLIRQGAQLLTSANDIVEAVAPTLFSPRSKEGTAESAIPDRFRILWDRLAGSSVPKEALALDLDMPVETLASLLFEMEVAGFVVSLPGGLVARTG